MTAQLASVPFGCAASGMAVLPFALDDDRDMALSLAAAMLAPAEAERAARFHFARDRDRYIRGRGYLRRSLARITGDTPQGLRLTEGPHGKPALEDGPEFNLTHSEGRAVLVISPEGPVGVDLEFVDRAVDVAALAAHCFSAEECRVLSALPESEAAHRFYAFWTAKEARMKVTGEGMSLPPKAINLDLRGGWPVGYASPADPPVRMSFLRLHLNNAICCIAEAAA